MRLVVSLDLSSVLNALIIFSWLQVGSFVLSVWIHGFSASFVWGQNHLSSSLDSGDWRSLVYSCDAERHMLKFHPSLCSGCMDFWVSRILLLMDYYFFWVLKVQIISDILIYVLSAWTIFLLMISVLISWKKKSQLFALLIFLN